MHAIVVDQEGSSGPVLIIFCFCTFCGLTFLLCFLWLWSNAFLVRHKHRHELIQPLGILIVKPADRRTIEIEYAEQSFTIK
jgi:hypothetical protein